MSIYAFLFIANVQAADLSFVVVGDTQTDGSHDSINWDVFPQIIEDMNTHHPQVGLFVGDLINGSYSLDDTISQWADFEQVVAGFEGMPLLVLGNHDVYSGSGTFDAFRETFDWLPTDDSPPGEEGISYYYDVDDVRFISITSDQETYNPFDVSAEGQAWMERVLSESGAFEQVFVFTHHPVSFSDEGGLGTTGGAFWQALLTWDVTAMFAGHWHRYQPSQLGNGGSTWEVILGTGGGAITYSPIREYQQLHGFVLVEVTGEEAVASFWGDADGDGYYDDEMDRFTMRSGQDIAGGLVARYRFDEGSVADSAPEPLGRGIGGELRGDAVIHEGGAAGKALWLDGQDDYAVAGAMADYALDIHDDLTISQWVRLDSVSSGSWSNVLLCYGTNDYYTEDEETNYAYWLNLESDTRLRMYWEYESGVNVSAFSSPGVVLDDGAWHHLAVVRSSAEGAVSFYLDGEPWGEAVSFERLPTGGGRGMLYFGADTEGDGDYEMAGALDEVCIFDLPLDADQVAALAVLEDCDAVLGEASEEEPEDSGQEQEGCEDSGGACPEGDGECDAGGCGCAVQPRGPVGGLLLLGLVGLWGRRRRGDPQ